MSERQFFEGAIIRGAIILREIILEGDCPGGNYPGGNCPVPAKIITKAKNLIYLHAVYASVFFSCAY